MDRQLRKLVVVGDGAVGKTSLLVALARGQFPTGYVPTVFDSHAINMEVKGECIQLTLWDTSAQGEGYERLRPLGYQDAHAFLICFSIDWPDSLDNVREGWDPEIKHFGGRKVPRFLVGCKKDLRDDPTTLSQLSRTAQSPVTTATEQGMNIAEVIRAEYLECLSKTGEGVRELFARVTESMEADRVVRFEHTRLIYHRPWYFGGGGCIVV